MEYSSTVWDPALQTHITALEQVQRQGSCYVCNGYHSRTPECVTKMLDNLNWAPLEVRRRHEQLGMLYRIQHSLVHIPIDRYLQVSHSHTTGIQTNLFSSGPSWAPKTRWLGAQPKTKGPRIRGEIKLILTPLPCICFIHRSQRPSKSVFFNYLP